MLRQFRHDAADGVDEAHVEHPVGFVEDENLDAIETQRPAVEMVDQAAWRRHQDVDAARQRLDLGAARDAAENHGAREVQMPAIGPEALGDLARELAGRRQDQGAAAPRLGTAPRRGEALEHRQREGRRLAGARLRDAAEVLAGKDMRDGLRLDRRRRDVLLGRERLQ